MASILMAGMASATGTRLPIAPSAGMEAMAFFFMASKASAMATRFPIRPSAGMETMASIFVANRASAMGTPWRIARLVTTRAGGLILLARKVSVTGIPFKETASRGMWTVESPFTGVMGTELKPTRFGAPQEKEQPMGFEQSTPRATYS